MQGAPYPFPPRVPTGSPPPGVRVRPAREEDIPAITRIYNQGIEDRIATLEGEPHTVEERLAWFRDRTEREPVLVAEWEGQVVGWASLSRWKDRACYAYTKELSIYVERSWRGRRIGTLLLAALLERARAVGVHKVLLFALPVNLPALALYRRFGFRTVGILRHHGVLDGVFRDLLCMEKDLAEDLPEDGE